MLTKVHYVEKNGLKENSGWDNQEITPDQQIIICSCSQILLLMTLILFLDSIIYKIFPK